MKSGELFERSIEPLALYGMPALMAAYLVWVASRGNWPCFFVFGAVFIVQTIRIWRAARW